MLNKLQGRINGESFRECLGGYAACGLLRENFHRLSDPVWNGMTMVASLSKCHPPQGTDLSLHSQARLNAIARQLNERPRKTLGFETPPERFNACFASTG